MEALDKKYQVALDNVKGAIQASDLLNTYLDSEEDDDYKALYEAYEPQIEEIYKEVADKNPLQLTALENYLLDEGFEGLYLPRTLGYAVLRGAVRPNVKYTRPQDHFRDILMGIVNSANFEVLKRRIGQSIQIGFALSSDIWITNIIASIKNKKVKYFLESLKQERYRDERNRRVGLKKYHKQFESLNYQSAVFPTSVAELKVLTQETNEFLIYRAHAEFDNTSLIEHINSLLDTLRDNSEHESIDLLMTIGMQYDLNDKSTKAHIEAFDNKRSNVERFEEVYFSKLEDLHNSSITVTPEMDKRMSNVINRKVDDEISKYYDLTDEIHSKGFIHEDTIEAVRKYTDAHEGLSPENESIRSTIYEYFATILNNLDEGSYQDYFEMNKIFTIYINIFNNQRFNQEVKALCLKYVKKLLKAYTDKRGRDYQDIKKFVMATFEDLGFMNAKELKELFKTKRKKKPVQ